MVDLSNPNATASPAMGASAPAQQGTRREAEELAGAAGMMALGGAATATLAIIALAGVAPLLLLEIACIVAGVSLVMGAMGAGLGTRRASGGAAKIGGASASFELVGGLAGVVLGILAIIGLAPVLLCEIAALALGGALLLSSILPARPGLFGIHEAWAEHVGEGAAAVQGLAGLGAVVLAILSLVGILGPALTLVALLCVGAGLLLTGAALFGGAMSGRLAHVGA
jgi:hypothetical protein